MSWWEAILLGVARVKEAGVAVSRSGTLNFLGGITAAYNDATNEIDVSFETYPFGSQEGTVTQIGTGGGTYTTVLTLSERTRRGESEATDWILDGKVMTVEVQVSYGEVGGDVESMDEAAFPVTIIRNGATKATAEYTLKTESQSNGPFAEPSEAYIQETLGTTDGLTWECRMQDGELKVGILQHATTDRYVKALAVFGTETGGLT